MPEQCTLMSLFELFHIHCNCIYNYSVIRFECAVKFARFGQLRWTKTGKFVLVRPRV